MGMIKRNPTSSITAFFAAVLVLVPFVAEFQEVAEPFGIDPQVYLIASAVLAGGVVLGQMWQAIVPYTVGVTWGIPSIAVFVGAAATAITPLVADLADALNPLGVPQDVWLQVSAGLALVGLFGRVWQAVAPGRLSDVIISEPVPEEGGAGEPPVT